MDQSQEQPSFESLGVDAAIQEGLRDLGYQQPLPVQQAVFQPIRDGRHVSLRAKTGTGKTAAFGIPLLDRLDLAQAGPSILVLAPTRELALQIATELSAIGKHRGVRVAKAYGGLPVSEQTQELRAGVHVVVGTPGRLLDLLERKVLRLDRVRSVVLDEADEMLSLGFFEDVTRLLDACSSMSQLVILSASLSQDTEGLIQRYALDVQRIDLSTDSLSVEGIRHVAYPMGDDLPPHHYLVHVIQQEQPSSALIFVNTRADASLVATLLAREGLQAEMISGELPQRERERVMGAIRERQLKFLVATDLAARGIDISDLSHVINYSLPEDPTIYLHRVGRTGRVGKVGTAVSLVSGKRLRTLGVLERQFGIRFEQREFPPSVQMVDDRNKLKLDTLVQTALDAISDGYRALAQAVRDHEQAIPLIAYLLKRHADSTHDESRSLENRPEPPRRKSSGRGSPRRGSPRRGGR